MHAVLYQLVTEMGKHGLRMIKDYVSNGRIGLNIAGEPHQSVKDSVDLKLQMRASRVVADLQSGLLKDMPNYLRN